MKGMIFAGCSFTWGQGLYFYHDMDKSHIPLKPNRYDESKLKSKDFLHKDTLRFPRLVSNHFNTFEVVQRYNGGSDDSSVYFVKEVFNVYKSNKESNYKFDFRDIDYVIFQTTQYNRTPFSFYIDGDEHFFNYNHMSDEFHRWENDDYVLTRNNKEKFFEYQEKYKLTNKDVEELHKKQNLEKIRDLFIYLDSNNIKTKILSWTDEYIDLLKNDDYFIDKFIQLNYNNKKFDCIDDLFEYDKTLKITHDPDKKIEVVDGHPSKKCHQVIAESIISHIEEYESKYPHYGT